MSDDDKTDENGQPSTVMSDDDKPEESGSPNILPFDLADLASIRVNQAGLARLMECSRQAVSEWVKSGKISTYPDGSIDPKRAYQEYMTNSDPGRMQHKMLKPITAEIDNLKKINSDLAADLRRKHEVSQRALAMLAEQAHWLEVFAERVEDAGEGGGWVDRVQEMFDQAGAQALEVDPSEALQRAAPDLAPFWQPAKP